MKKYLRELLILFVQLTFFYLFPLVAEPYGPMGMVLIILLSVFILALLMGLLSDSKRKFLYPPVVAVLFIPSVFIFYNESALVHALWYLVVSAVGLLPGSLLRKLFSAR